MRFLVIKIEDLKNLNEANSDLLLIICLKKLLSVINLHVKIFLKIEACSIDAYMIINNLRCLKVLNTNALKDVKCLKIFLVIQFIQFLEL